MTNFINAGDHLSTPALSKGIERDIKDAVAHGQKSLEEDWINVESTPCKACFGTGVDGEDHSAKCIACNGTGKDYTLTYGVEDGKIFARAEQHGLDAYVAYCAGRREEERNNPTAHHNTMGLVLCQFPSIVRIEMIARGIPVDEMVEAGENVELAKACYETFGDTFMTTNLKPWLKTKTKAKE